MNITLYDYIKEYKSDKYCMEVLYYTLKHSMANHDFTFNKESGIIISDKFLAEPTTVLLEGEFYGKREAFALVLSVRALMLNQENFVKCNRKYLIFEVNINSSLRWLDYVHIIEECKHDNEFVDMMSCLTTLHTTFQLSQTEITRFNRGIVCPEYRNLMGHYANVAAKSDKSDYCINDNAFLCNYGIEDYTVSEEIEYVGNTAFAFCPYLTTIRFKRKDTLFGKFPIIECSKLTNIIVPDDAVDYYQSALPYYASIIKPDMASDCNVEADVSETEDKEEILVETTSQEKDSTECKPQIDTKLLMDVFKHKSSSYKYFWLLSILELIKENQVLTYENLTVRMLSIAWPYVITDNLSLGQNDQLATHDTHIMKDFRLSGNESAESVRKYLRTNLPYVRTKIQKKLLKDVPYRFLSPWIKYVSDADVIEKSKDLEYATPYALETDCIVMDEDWHEYIMSNYDNVYKFAKDSLTEYLKQYNSPLQLLRVMAQ